MEEENKNKEIIQNFYLSTYGEEIRFDDVKQKGHYLIASKKQGKERFLRGVEGIESERNSAIYYMVNTSSKTDTRMVITSQSSVCNEKGAKTDVTIYQGKNKLFDFGAFDAYIDTADVLQVSSFLAGRYLGAEYTAYSSETNDLHAKWHSKHGSDIDAETSLDTREIYQKYLKVKGRELRKGLLKAKALFDICTDEIQSANMLARVRAKLADVHNIVKICSKPRQVEGGKAFGLPREM